MTTNASSSTTSQWLRKAARQLEQAGIATARLDCLVLLEDATGQDRSWLLAHPEHRLVDHELDKLAAQIKRRAAHEPLAYIRGKTEFYGREFAVTAHTLEPRPETEDMIDLLKQIWPESGQAVWVADVGTGSGAIGITAALELDHDHIDLIDIDADALRVARQNVRRHGLKLACLAGDLLLGAPRHYDIVLANLPYVPDGHTINQAAMQEPAHAIFGGSDGLDYYRRLFAESPRRHAHVLTESLPPQHATLTDIARQHGYRLRTSRGFIQAFVPA